MIAAVRAVRDYLVRRGPALFAYAVALACLVRLVHWWTSHTGAERWSLATACVVAYAAAHVAWNGLAGRRIRRHRAPRPPPTESRSDPEYRALVPDLRLTLRSIAWRLGDKAVLGGGVLVSVLVWRWDVWWVVAGFFCLIVPVYTLIGAVSSVPPPPLLVLPWALDRKPLLELRSDGFVDHWMGLGFVSWDEVVLFRTAGPWGLAVEISSPATTPRIRTMQGAEGVLSWLTFSSPLEAPLRVRLDLYGEDPLVLRRDILALASRSAGLRLSYAAAEWDFD